jgi:hypothetical protein
MRRTYVRCEGLEGRVGLAVARGEELAGMAVETAAREELPAAATVP